jgi:hypothetical protein
MDEGRLRRTAPPFLPGQGLGAKSVVDFGHAKQIFEEADVFPCIIVAEKPGAGEKPKTARLCTIPREQLRINDLTVQIAKEGAEIDVEQLSAEAWQLEQTEVMALLARLQSTGTKLVNFVGSDPIYGLKTGCNEAFFVADEEKQALVKADPSCATLFVRYFRGQDVKRWESEWNGEWLIALRSSNEKEWPWTGHDDPNGIFAKTYPSICAHMSSHHDALHARKNTVKNWWELSGFKAWEIFTKPKLVYQEIQFHPSYALESNGIISNNKTFILPTDDLYLLAVLNSPLMWWHNWRYLPHMKDEALTPVAIRMSNLPIAEPTPAVREACETAVRRLIEITASQQQTVRSVLDWLRVEYAIQKPSQKLQSLIDLDTDAFVAEVKKGRGKKQPLTAASLAALRDEHTRTIAPARTLAAEAVQLERTLSDLVNEAYGLTPGEVDLMWQTAPPRMPIPRPR